LPTFPLDEVPTKSSATSCSMIKVSCVIKDPSQRCSRAFSFDAVSSWL
jgi:hypothetical protein